MYLRWLLTALLLYGVSTETGIFTTITFILIAVRFELDDYIYSLRKRRVR